MVSIPNDRPSGKGRKSRAKPTTQAPDLPASGEAGSAAPDVPTPPPAAKRKGRGKKPPALPAADPTPAADPAPTEPPPAAERPVDPADFTPSGYTAVFGGTCHCEIGVDKETGALVVRKRTRLANFAARI